MKNVKAASLKRLVSRFSDKKILVIGDIMLDRYIWGDVERISPEAPIPVVHVKKENNLAGGAANVANNIRALGGQVVLAGMIGQDRQAEQVLQVLKKQGIQTNLILRDQSRPTISKTRVIAHSQQVVRIDRENPISIKPAMEQSIVNKISRMISRVDGVILSDYNKGFLTASLCERVIALAKKHNKMITGDPKPENIDKFKGVTLISPNQMESEKASHIKITDKASLNRAGKTILDQLHCEAVLITRGEEGMALFEKNGDYSDIHTVAREVYDVSGAGDTVIATLTLALAAGGNFKEAAVAANCAAGLTVGEVGVATTDQDELKKWIGEEPWK